MFRHLRDPRPVIRKRWGKRLVNRSSRIHRRSLIFPPFAFFGYEKLKRTAVEFIRRLKDKADFSRQTI
jgi:hypothetical protein